MTWINFKKLKQDLSFRAVLLSCGVQVKPEGHRYQGPCPLPMHTGKGKSSCFSAQLDRGIWQCFGCGAKGNVLDFAIHMEGLDPGKNEDVRTVALKLQEQFHLESGPKPSAAIKPPMHAAPKAPEEATTNPKPTVVINPPLDFLLKDLDAHHPYLYERGLSDETIDYFGLGCCYRGLMKNRIAIPLHSTEGQLIGYVGRLVKDKDVSEHNPKYLLPGTRERQGKLLEFHKSKFLYNGHRHRLKGPQSDLVVVEGFSSVWWLHQAGMPHVTALMGSDCSDEQAKIILSLTTSDSRIWLMPDGDEAGARCAQSLFLRLAPSRFVRWIKLEKGRQPTDLASHELHNLMLTP